MKSCLKFFEHKALPFLTIAIGCMAIYFAVKYCNQPLLEHHSFRQTQTALTSLWMIREGWQLAYQTPVVGYPWSIPYEFPIYQSVVALIAWLGHFQLDSIGRLVSLVFLLACAWPAFKITRLLKLPTSVAWIFCALLWSSPIYLYWGRAFMIETTATFFAFAAIPYVVDIFNPIPRWRSVLMFTFWATLGILQKSTTATPVILICAIVTCVFHLKMCGLRIPSVRKIAFVIAAFILPAIIGLLWTNYADYIKAQNPFGIYLTSTALSGWNFGTIQQRFDVNILKTIFWDRLLVENAAAYFGISLLIVTFITSNRKIKQVLLANLILFISPIFIFTNLHFVHDYYQVSSTLFLLFALAVATVYFLPGFIGHNLIIIAVTLILVVSNYYHYSKGYATYVRRTYNPSNSTTYAISDVIKRYTPHNSVIVVYGADWSSEYAYYSERKSFTVPVWFNEYDIAWNDPTVFLGNKQPRAIVFCDNNLIDILLRTDVRQQPSLYIINSCFLWMPDVKSIILSGENQPMFPYKFNINYSSLIR